MAVNKPIVESCTCETGNVKLINISTNYVASVPIYMELFIENSTANTFSQQKVILKKKDYTLLPSPNKYNIQISLPVYTNEQYLLQAQVYFLDETNTPFSDWTFI